MCNIPICKVLGVWPITKPFIVICLLWLKTIVTRYMRVTWSEDNTTTVTYCDASDGVACRATTSAISANLSNYWTVSRFVARVYVLFLKLNNFALYCAASRFSSIVQSVCEQDGKREARAGRVLHLSRAALPAVLNITTGGGEGEGARAVRPALLI